MGMAVSPAAGQEPKYEKSQGQVYVVVSALDGFSSIRALSASLCPLFGGASRHASAPVDLRVDLVFEKRKVRCLCLIFGLVTAH